MENVEDQVRLMAAGWRAWLASIACNYFGTGQPTRAQVDILVDGVAIGMARATADLSAVTLAELKAEDFVRLLAAQAPHDSHRLTLVEALAASVHRYCADRAQEEDIGGHRRALAIPLLREALCLALAAEFAADSGHAAADFRARIAELASPHDANQLVPYYRREANK